MFIARSVGCAPEYSEVRALVRGGEERSVVVVAGDVDDLWVRK